MRPEFYCQLLNGQFEDPVLVVNPPNEKRVLLFDAGDISRLPHTWIWRISDVFVTHTHIDHFIGFDSILRVILRRDMPLNVYGPPNITACVAGKLRGYSWNLIKEYPASINVFAFNGKTVTHTLFRAGNSFKKELMSRYDSDGTLLNTGVYKVKAVRLAHNMPCLAYALEEDLHINIDRDHLLKKGLGVGPWLNDFKKHLRAGDKNIEMSIDGKAYTVDELSDIAIIKKGQKVSYATDIALTRANITKLIRLVKDSDTFYCEAYFLDSDRERALKRSHLTAKVCGTIARRAGVRNLSLMHISPRYIDSADLVTEEAMSAFLGTI